MSPSSSLSELESTTGAVVVKATLSSSSVVTVTCLIKALCELSGLPSASNSMGADLTAETCQDAVSSKSGSCLTEETAASALARPWSFGSHTVPVSSTVGRAMSSSGAGLRVSKPEIAPTIWRLRARGIEVDGPTNVFTDNESAFKSATKPELTLAKKHNAIACHRTSEAAAAKIVRIAWEDGQFDVADVLTKLLAGPKLRQLISCVLS